MGVKPGLPEALTAEISQGRWLVIADTTEPPEQFKPPASQWLGLLVAVAENRRNLAWVTAAGTLLVCLGSFLIPNHYTASAQLLPSQQNQSGVSNLLGQFGDLASLAGRDALKSPNALFVSLLRSRTVSDAVITRTGLMKVYGKQKLSDCRTKLEKQTQVDALKEGTILLQVEDRDPQRAAAITNAYVEELIALNKRLAVGEAGRRRIFFEQQVKDAREHLADAEDALKQTQEHTGMVQLDSQAKAVMEVQGVLRAHIALKKAQLEKMRLFATEQNPDLTRLKTELTSMQKQLQESESRGQENGGLDFSSAKLPASGLEYMRRLREVKYHELVFEMLSKQLELARIDEAKEGSLIQVIDPAVVPDRKSGPSRGLITAIGFVVSVCLSVGWIAIQNTLARARLRPETSAQLNVLRNTLALSRGKNGKNDL